MGQRHKAREFALQALYMYESVNSSLEELTSMKWLNKEIPEDLKNFSVSIISGSIKNIKLIDDLIKKYSKNWKFERLDIIDKSILRLSIYTLLFLQDIPTSVVINEGVNLAKSFGGENSSQFINGILDKIKEKELILDKEGKSSGESQREK
jgi:transcription antitermination protein NusB